MLFKSKMNELTNLKVKQYIEFEATSSELLLIMLNILLNHICLLNDIQFKLLYFRVNYFHHNLSKVHAYFMLFRLMLQIFNRLA